MKKDFFLKSAWIPASVVFIVSLVVYMLTLARTVTLVDSGELIVSCALGGAAHPPGFPFYTLVGRFFAILPIGNMAFRIGFLSAFFSAAAAAFIALAVREIMLRTPIVKRQSAKAGKKRSVSKSMPDVAVPEQWIFLLIPIAAGLTFAFSVTPWAWAVVAEVYALNTFLMSLSLFCALRWRRLRLALPDPDAALGRGWILGSAIAFSLALGVHHVTVALVFPALCALVVLTASFRWLGTRTFFLTAAAAAATVILVYLYLFFAASHPAGLNWGQPDSFDRLWRHITGWQYRVNLFEGKPEVIRQELSNLSSLLYREATPVWILAALFGMGVLWRNDRRLLAVFALVIIFNVGWNINYEIAEDKDAYYLPILLVLNLASAAGMSSLAKVKNHPSSRALARIILVLLILLPAECIVIFYHENDRSHLLIARDYAKNALKGVGPGGLLLTLDWQLYSPCLYMRHIEGFRRDAVVVDVNLLRRSWYTGSYISREYPETARACQHQIDDFLDALRPFEEGRLYDENLLQIRFLALIQAMVDYHSARSTVAMTLPMETDVGSGMDWVPVGLAMQLFPRGSLQQGEIPPAPELELRGLMDETTSLDSVAKEKIIPSYAKAIADRSRYLILAGQIDKALPLMELALRLRPAFDVAYEFIGSIRTVQGRIPEAILAYQTALQFNPSNAVAAARLKGSNL